MTKFGKLIIGFIGAGIVIVLGWYVFSGLYIDDKSLASVDAESEGYVYETEAESADECSSYEKFDEENNICYFECTDENECKEISDAVDAELDSWAEDYQNDREPVAEKSIPEGDESQEADYKVSAGENITLLSGDDKDEYRKIWEDIKELSPDTLSDTYIEEFQIFNNKDDDTLAFVDDYDGNGKWRVAVNLAGHNTSSEREQKSTIVHELGHIISLNTSQVDPNIQKENCQNLSLDEGCAKNNSYVNKFWKNFWESTSSRGYVEGKYVTEYAATNEVEDWAESFAYFVLAKDGRSGGENFADQKVGFMYQFNDLVSIRNGMRNVLSKDIVRAKKSLN